MRFRFLILLVAALLVGKEKEKPLKNPAWPPKAGIKTPGIQVPFANLKAEVELTLEGTPSAILTEGMNVLIPIRDKGVIARIANRDNKAQESWKGLEEPCGGIVSAFGTLWAPDCKKQSITRLEARSGKVSASVGAGVGKAKLAIAASGDSVWVLSDEKGTLTRIDPANNSILSELRLSPSCNALYYEQDSLWATCPAENKLLRIQPKTNLVDQRIETALEPVAMAFGEAHIWVLGNKDGKVSKIDPKTNKEVATVETGVPNGNGSIAFGDGFVWVSSTGYPLTKIDPKTDKVMQQFAGDGGSMVRFGMGSIWLVNPAKMTVSRFDPKRIALTLPD
jgi:virginiamycin B lyase